MAAKKPARGKKAPPCPACAERQAEYLEENTFMPDKGGPMLKKPIIMDPDGVFRCVSHTQVPEIQQIRTNSAKYAQQGRTIKNLREELEGARAALKRKKKGVKHFAGGLSSVEERLELREDLIEKTATEKDVSKLNLVRQLLVDQTNDNAKSGARKPWGGRFVSAVARVRRDMFEARIEYLEGLLIANDIVFEDGGTDEEDAGERVRADPA